MSFFIGTTEKAGCDIHPRKKACLFTDNKSVFPMDSMSCWYVLVNVIRTYLEKREKGVGGWCAFGGERKIGTPGNFFSLPHFGSKGQNGRIGLGSR